MRIFEEKHDGFTELVFDLLENFFVLSSHLSLSFL